MTEFSTTLSQIIADSDISIRELSRKSGVSREGHTAFHLSEFRKPLSAFCADPSVKEKIDRSENYTNDDQHNGLRKE